MAVLYFLSKGEYFMSYEILYGTNFLKLDENTVLPMILSGSSNCTEYNPLTGREMLERNWWPYIPKYKEADPTSITVQLSDIPKIKQFFDSLDKDTDLFERNGSFISPKTAKIWYVNALENAITIEEYQKYNYGCSLHCAIVIYKDSVRKPIMNKCCKTTYDILQWLSEASEYIAESKTNNPELCFFYNLSFGCKKQFKKPNTRDVNEPVAIKGKLGYLSKVAETSQTYSKDIFDAMVFENSLEAQEFLFSRQLTNRIANIVFVKVRPILKQKEYKYVIGVDQSAILFLKRISARRVFLDYDINRAKTFATESAAKKYIEKYSLGSRFNAKFFVVDKTATLQQSK